MKINSACLSFLFLLFSFSLSFAQIDTPNKPLALTDESCLSCHGKAGFKPSVNAEDLKKSIHSELSCLDCHSDIKSLPHPTNLLKASCDSCHTESAKRYNNSSHGKALAAKIPGSPVCSDCHGAHDIYAPTHLASKLFWQNIPSTCGKCHGEILKEYNRSVHGKAVIDGKREAPVCTNCHGEHSVNESKEQISKIEPAHITETCGQCHQAKHIISKYQLPNDVVETYMQSFHGLSIRRGSLTAANCASCHGKHSILPSSDKNSSIYPGNLIKTCGQCHAGISEQFVKEKIHSGLQLKSNKSTHIVRNFYFFLIVFTIGLMLLHNFLDLYQKMKAHYQHMARLGKIVRMNTSERIQHLFLLVSFLVLAYSGFALKFPNAWWTMPFMGAIDWRGYSHRLAASIFIILCVYHIWYMFCTSKGRWQLKALLPQWIDVVQCGQTFAYYLGLRKEKPKPAFYGYIEKVEYWALVWGSIIMVITGCLLLYKEWSMKYLPKWLFDVVMTIHYYEAILACLSILIWHFYFTIFDPDVYPMKWTWVSGKSAPVDDERVNE